MKAGTDRREFRKVRPSKSRKGRCERPWSEGSPEALNALRIFPYDHRRSTSAAVTTLAKKPPKLSSEALCAATLLAAVPSDMMSTS